MSAERATCAVCGVTGRRTRAWHPDQRRGQVTGWRCPDCPGAGEPIKRRVNGAGVRWRVTTDTGTRPDGGRRQETRHFPTLPEARAWLVETRAAVEAGEHDQPEPEQVTVAQAAGRWLSSRRATGRVRAVTLEGYGHMLAPVLRRLGDRPLRSVTPAECEALRDWLAVEGGKGGRPLGPRSVNGALGRLSQVTDWSVRAGLVEANPVRGVERVRVASRRPEDHETWTPGQVVAFRAAADADVWAAAWRLSLCGLRRSEVLGLRWSDVDTDAGVVHVRQGRVAVADSVGGSVVGDPKSGVSERVVPVEAIHAGTVAALRRWRMAAPASDPAGLVVVDRDGEPPTPEHYSDRFRAVCVAAGVPPVRLHSLRHTLATAMVRANVPHVDGAALLGHSVEVYLSTYVRSSSAGIGAAAVALGEVFTAAG